jgi:hypothetical protein
VSEGCWFIELAKDEQLGFRAGKESSCCLLSSSIGFLVEVSLENYFFVIV